ncbi:MAG: hypothetical protein J6C83_04980 [Peptococcaceae bacterium]|nr:hypothetical protein [Peptococcaceae bacterium]MBO5139779.1 hypothetical protein [Peptococcaceae bacterium]
MDAVIVPILLGVFISILGFSNMKGNISSVHWYHRKRITEENKVPFGRMTGLGTIICGVSIVIFGCLSFAAMQTQMEFFITIGSVIVVIGLVIGLALSIYAMMKYNKGIF